MLFDYIFFPRTFPEFAHTTIENKEAKRCRMKEKREIVYLKADRNSVCHDPKIKIQDVMSVQCADPAICAGIKNKTLYTFKKNDGQKKEGKKKKRMEVFSMLNVIERIQTDYPDVEIVSIGEQDFVVQLLDAPMAPKWLETLKVVVMVVVIFLGAAFTIMAFNNDVSVGGSVRPVLSAGDGKRKTESIRNRNFLLSGTGSGNFGIF